MLLSVENLSTSFHLRSTVVQAVRGVSFGLERAEILGIVGESGSGKTVLAHSLLRLLPHPPARIRGAIRFGGNDLLTCDDNVIRSIRGNEICMIFQDPSTSFNPYQRLVDQLVEPLLLHRSLSRTEAVEQAVAALDETGIPDAARRIHSYPHEFSGGMLQRAMIAMALVMRPKVVLADEPTTALDVTVQAQLLRLMRNLRDRYAMTVLFITHNLGIVAGFCDRVLVMYAGCILESAPAIRLFGATAHPYTRALIRSVPDLTGGIEQLYSIPGVPPDPAASADGCPFFPRCPYGADECTTTPPHLEPIGDDHATACIRFRNGGIAW
ncbi:MAG: ABC transporter ATP-binding protein [Chitinispirillaceae bacterium]|nr:ABC transporter ATP-binding protein [Chitinispirillaceae bacterium]